MNESEELENRPTEPDILKSRIAQVDAEVEELKKRLLPKQLKQWEKEEVRRIELEEEIFEMRKEIELRDVQLMELEKSFVEIRDRWTTLSSNCITWYAALVAIASRDAYGNPEAHYMKKKAQEALDAAGEVVE